MNRIKHLTTRSSQPARTAPAPSTTADAFDDRPAEQRRHVDQLAIADAEAGIARNGGGHAMLPPGEQGYCPNCVNPIPHHNLSAKLRDRKPGEPLTREVRGLCDVCGLLHAQVFECVGGEWQPRGASYTVLDEAERKQFVVNLRATLDHYARRLAC